MEWDLEFGPSIEKLLALQEAGKEVPALDRRADLALPPYLEWVWRAYSELMRTRVWMMGAPQAISLTEILAWSKITGLGREDTEELLGFTRLLDDVYFKRLEAKAKAKKHGRARSHSRRPGRGKRR